MRVQVVGAASVAPGYPLSCLLIDDYLAVDAGSLGWFAPVEKQAAIQYILLTHSHLDHLAGLPIFLDNIYGLKPEPPTVYGLAETLSVLQQHLFNDHLMPDFLELSKKIAPFLRLQALAVGIAQSVGAYQVQAIALRHTVPTVGYLIEDGQVAVLVLTDTAPMPELYAALAAVPRLRAVFLEASFPDEQAALAQVSQHLTASQFVEWASHFPNDVPVYAIHVKPRYYDQVTAEVLASGRRNLVIAEPGLVVEL